MEKSIVKGMVKFFSHKKAGIMQQFGHGPCPATPDGTNKYWTVNTHFKK